MSYYRCKKTKQWHWNLQQNPNINWCLNLFYIISMCLPFDWEVWMGAIIYPFAAYDTNILNTSAFSFKVFSWPSGCDIAWTVFWSMVVNSQVHVKSMVLVWQAFGEVLIFLTAIVEICSIITFWSNKHSFSGFWSLTYSFKCRDSSEDIRFHGLEEPPVTLMGRQSWNILERII